jgi:hypothetical protein
MIESPISPFISDQIRLSSPPAGDNPYTTRPEWKCI